MLRDTVQSAGKLLRVITESKEAVGSGRAEGFFTPNLLPGRQGEVHLFEQCSKWQGRR